MSLIDYVKENNMDQVKRLILAGIDVNVTDNWNRTVLWHAAYRGHIWCVEALIEARADVKILRSSTKS